MTLAIAWRRLPFRATQHDELKRKNGEALRGLSKHDYHPIFFRKAFVAPLLMALPCSVLANLISITTTQIDQNTAASMFHLLSAALPLLVSMIATPLPK